MKSCLYPTHTCSCVLVIFSKHIAFLCLYLCLCFCVGAELLRHELSVPCQKFVLFLYIQHIHKISLRASLVSGSDEYPLKLSWLNSYGRII